MLYAPTWSPASSLNLLGIDLLTRLRQLPVNVIVKLHDRSRDPRRQYSGGVDWPARSRRFCAAGSALLASDADICPYLAAADVMITDHSSAGFEYLLLDRPLVRIHVPELITLANIHQDYVQMLTEVSDRPAGRRHDRGGRAGARRDPLRRPRRGARSPPDLFFEPGTATQRCADALYEAFGLSPAAVVRHRQPRTRLERFRHSEPRTPAPEACVPTVSVIMPAYNAEGYLARRGRVGAPPVVRDLELLIVDDGSSDRTVEIARGLAIATRACTCCSRRTRDPVRRAMPASARAKGRLFAFLDSDDEWDETFLAEHVAVLEARPYSRRADRQRAQPRRRAPRPAGAPGRRRRPAAPLATILGDERSLFIMTVFRRTVIDAVGGFDPSLFTNEEYDMWIRASLAGFTFAPASEAARLVQLPIRQPVVERHPDALGHPSGVREDAAGAGDHIAERRDPRKAGQSIRGGASGSERARQLHERRGARRCAILGELHARPAAPGCGSCRAGEMDALGRPRCLSCAGPRCAAPSDARGRGTPIGQASDAHAGRRQHRKALPVCRPPPQCVDDADAASIGAGRTPDRPDDRPIGWGGAASSWTFATRCTARCSSRLRSALERDPRVAVSYTSERLSEVHDRLGQKPSGRVLTHRQVAWRRWDLYLSADPWTRPTLRRCARYANVFHGVAGKCRLDNPAHLPIAYHQFDRVLFINRDRMERYLAAGLVTTRARRPRRISESRSARQR